MSQTSRSSHATTNAYKKSSVRLLNKRMDDNRAW